MSATVDLDEFLAACADRCALCRSPTPSAEIAAAGQRVWTLAQDGGPGPALRRSTGINPDGDRQIRARRPGRSRFSSKRPRRAPVAAYASEEQAEPVALDASQPLALAIDPLDGSSNVDLNLSFGTIFSILPALATERAGTARELPAAGQPPARRRPRHLRAAADPGRSASATARMSSPIQPTGRRLPARRENPCAFRRTRGGVRDQRLELPPLGRVRAALFRRLRQGRARTARARLQHALARLAGGRGLSHPDARRRLPLPGRQARRATASGRLRLVYEANPVAFVIEQAGGSATERHRADPVAHARAACTSARRSSSARGGRSPS